MESSALKNGNDRFGALSAWMKASTPFQFVCIVFCFLFARAGFFVVIKPFSLALYCAACFPGPARILAAVAVIAGNSFFSGFYETLRQAVAIIIFELLSRFAGMSMIRASSIIRPALMAASTAATGLVKGIVLGLHLYDVITSLLSSALVFSISTLITPAVSGSEQAKAARQFSTSRNVTAKAIVMFAAILSLEGITVGGVELSGVLAGVLVLIYARKRGSAFGACVGAGIGFMLALYRIPGSLELPGMLALAGAAAGMRVKRRTASVGLWMAVATIFMGLAALAGNPVYGFYSILASGIVFLFIPLKALNAVSEFVAGGAERGKTSDGVQAGRAAYEAADRLYVLGKALSRVSRNIGEYLDDELEGERTMAESVIEIVADRVCRRCMLTEKCWGTNFMKTYKLVEKAVLDLRTDEAGLPEFPPWFRSMCTRSDRFIENLGIAFSIFKVERVWRSRLAEARERIADQAGAISGSVMNIARTIMDRRYRNYEIEESFLEAASAMGLPVADIRVGADGGARTSMDIVCEEAHKLDIDALDKTVRAFLGNQVTRMGEVRRDILGYSVLRYMNKPRYKTVTGVARLSMDQSPVSGDSFTFLITGDGLHVSAVSDGAGSGIKAEKYSKNTIQMLEYLLEDGLDVDFAVKLIKIYLGIRGEHEALATLDVCAVSLMDGSARFFKANAPPSFIKTASGTVEIPESNDDGNGEIADRIDRAATLTEGDLVILVSDGIYEAFCEERDPSSLQKYIAGIETINPQQIADMIMTESTLRSQGARDDMTVLVTRLW
jgi:stage II sporulation protein E